MMTMSAVAKSVQTVRAALDEVETRVDALEKVAIITNNYSLVSLHIYCNRTSYKEGETYKQHAAFLLSHNFQGFIPANIFAAEAKTTSQRAARTINDAMKLLEDLDGLVRWMCPCCCCIIITHVYMNLCVYI